EIQPELQQMLDGIAGVQSFAFAISTLPGAGGGLPVQFAIKSPDATEVVAQVADQIADEARRSGRFIIVDTTLKYDSPELMVEIDRDKAAALGITMQDIGNTLGVLLSEGNISRFDVQGRSY